MELLGEISDNDYIFDNYDCHCKYCDIDYHGPNHTMVCHKCYSVQFMKELEKPAVVKIWPIIKFFLIVIIVIVIIS